MRYCPYCSSPISENAKTCHKCKRNLNLDALADVLVSNDESHINKKALRKIWFKEHAIYIWPVLTAILGFITGGIILYMVALGQFASEKDTLNSEIKQLKSQISDINSNAQNARSDLQEQVQAKDQIITVLSEQRVTLTRIINFTRRMAVNSIITPNSADEATSFRRNFRYLERQFNSQQEQLGATSFEEIGRFNLETLPQFLEN